MKVFFLEHLSVPLYTKHHLGFSKKFFKAVGIRLLSLIFLCGIGGNCGQGECLGLDSAPKWPCPVIIGPPIPREDQGAGLAPSTSGMELFWAWPPPEEWAWLLFDPELEEVSTRLEPRMRKPPRPGGRGPLRLWAFWWACRRSVGVAKIRLSLVWSPRSPPLGFASDSWK